MSKLKDAERLIDTFGESFEIFGKSIKAEKQIDRILDAVEDSLTEGTVGSTLKSVAVWTAADAAISGGVAGAQKLMRKRRAKKACAKYKNNPEGFFEHMEQSQSEKFEYDKANGIITITTPERDCVCGMVNSKITPAYFCQCSIGWQKQTYETILGKAIDVELKESVLRGSKRCVFEVRIRNDKSV